MFNIFNIFKRDQEIIDLDQEIINDLANYYNGKKIYSSYGFCKKYNIQGKEKLISYKLRNLRRKINIAQYLEEEYFTNSVKEILEKYKNEIIKEIPQ